MWIRGLLAGLVIGVLLALALNALDSSLKTVDQAEEYLKLPVLGALPLVKSRKPGKTEIIMSEHAKSRGAEAFRTLRTSLSMLGRAEDRRTFLFTSAVPQEGKTFTSVNYAVSLAQQGLRTLLIDGDLRRPAVEKALKGQRTQHVGVTDFLTAQKNLKDVVQSTEHENLFLISAGTTSPNPAELLGRGSFNRLIDEALNHFDRIVVDSAPVHAVSDSLLMLERIQTLCMLVRAGSTPRPRRASGHPTPAKGRRAHRWNRFEPCSRGFREPLPIQSATTITR
jgi:capsular exopolysaccharide synthesis family protein